MSPLFVITEKELVLIFDDNLLFSSAISGQLEKRGIENRVITAPLLQGLNSISGRPALAVLNLNAQSFDSLKLIGELKERAPMRILGFCGHGQTLLMQQAKEAGCAWVIPNSVAAKRIVHFLKQQDLHLP